MQVERKTDASRAVALAALGPTIAFALAVAAVACTSSSTTSTSPTPLKCQVSLATPSGSLGATGGTGTVSVTTEVECNWTASADVSWISQIAPQSSQGAGQLQFAVTANPVPAARQGNIVINDQRVAILQDAASCHFDIAPVTQAFGAGGGTGAAAVTGTSGCSWTAASGVPWVVITAGASGSGGGTVTFQVGANNGAARSGLLTLAGQTFTVTQAAGTTPPSDCVYSISPTSQSFPAGGGAGVAVALTTTVGCTWTATSNAAWATITSGASGSGSGTVAFTVAPNAGTARTGMLTIAGQVFTATQAGACSYSINPTSASVGASSGPGAPVAVTATAGCTWTSTSNAAWITITSGASGSGNGTVAFTAAANPAGPRTGTLTIAGQTFTVTQAGSCSYSINPTNASIDASGGAGAPVAVTATTGCTWTSTSNAPWITITSGASGNGNGTVGFTAAANAGGLRTGMLTIAGQTFTLTQSAPCSYSINPTSESVDKNGNGASPVTVSTATGCTWTSTSNDSWITITSGASGSGNGHVMFNVASNPGTARTGTLTIAGQTVTINEDHH